MTNSDTPPIDGAYDNVRVVLVGTTHPGNIGASARAMKAMGLTDLALVTPKIFPSAEATARASGADDLLAAATVHESLSAAIDGCTVVFGTTARSRHLAWPVISPSEAGEAIAGTNGRVALVFGREQSGLSNQELDLCQRAIRIPTAEGFSSLNLSQAVQICAYEVRKAFESQGKASVPVSDGMATATELDNLHDHLMKVMTEVGYHDPTQPKLLDRRVRRMINKADMESSEVQILRGFLSAVRQVR